VCLAETVSAINLKIGATVPRIVEVSKWRELTVSEIIDLNEAMERVMDDKDLLLELLNDLQADYIRKRKILIKAVQMEDFSLIRDTAHSLKGGSGNVSAKTIYNCFMMMENMAESKRDMALIHELVFDVDRQFEELSQFVKDFDRKVA
jgi:HPt (histidine-containing phosphotransfer) domain-containing protein